MSDPIVDKIVRKLYDDEPVPNVTLTRSDLEYLLERLDDASQQETWISSDIHINGAVVRIMED